jgi:hypothetical protein
VLSSIELVSLIRILILIDDGIVSDAICVLEYSETILARWRSYDDDRDGYVLQDDN